MVAGWRSLVATLVVVLAMAVPGLPAARAQALSPEATTPEGWLPHPLPAPVVPTVAFIGDSIGRDAQSYVRSQIGRSHAVSYYHAVAAGYIGYHQFDSPLLSVLRARNGPDILLVELGTGDAFWDHSANRFEADIRRFLDAVLPHVTCVRWFDQKPTANIAYPYVNKHRLEFNRILGRVLAEPRYASRNVALVSYAAWDQRSGERGFFLADRLHHTQAGRRELGLLAGQAAEGCDPATASGRFWDVPDRSGSAEAINWMAAAGIAEPFRNGAFRARLGSFSIDTDRGQVADFLWRLAGAPARPSTTWTDIPRALRPAAAWAEHDGIMRAYTGDTFHPAGSVSRASLATYLWRMLGRPTEGVTARPWLDVPPSLAAGVDWAVTAGVMAPVSEDTFGADVSVTRAQAAKALYAFAHLLPPPAAPSPPTTGPPDTTIATPTTVPEPPATTTTTPATTVTTTSPATTIPPVVTTPAGEGDRRRA